MGRKEWDERYQRRSDAWLDPSSLLVSLDDVLPRRGRALDVAGGAGRHAVYLATRGLDVTLVDFSEVGLQRAEARAVEVGVPLQTVARDLETEGLPGGTWDLILCFHYLQRSLLGEFASALRLGGMVVLVHPTQSNLSRHARPSARHLLADGELERGIPGLETLRYEEGWLDEGRHEARLIATKAT